MNYKKFMLQVINDADKFKYTAKPNPVVGAILLKDESIISSGYHEQYGCNHAEINAIENAKKILEKCLKIFLNLLSFVHLSLVVMLGRQALALIKLLNQGLKMS